MSLKGFYLRQQFHPGWVGIFLNPFYLIRKDLRSKFLTLIPQLKGQLLDYGCGRKPYKELFSVDSYIGVDIVNPGHPHTNEDIDLFFDGKSIPAPDASYDAVFSSEVFEHVFTPDESLKDIYRVLKPGGLFLTSVPFVWNEHEVPYDYARYSSFGYPHLLKKQGFEILEVHKTGNFIRVIAQLWNLYLYNRIQSWPLPLRLLVSILFITPSTLAGICLSSVLPRDTSLFFNLVVLARKPL
jgi:SAM-dependent methyltransferase